VKQIEEAYDLDYIRETLGPTTDPGQAMRWLARQPAVVQIEAIKIQTDLLRQSRGQAPEDKRPEHCYATLVTAIQMMRGVHDQLHRKGKPDPKLAKRIDLLRASSVKAPPLKKKEPPKRRTIRMHYLDTITELLDRGLTWRQIALYLHRFHRFKVSPAYLHETYRSLAGDAHDRR